MSSRFLIAPQWQGSGSSRAMRLIDGAEAIRRDLPSGATQLIEVPLEAGDSEGTGILRFSSIRLVRERLQQALADIDGPAVVIGGDCGVEYAPIEHAARHGRVLLLWADAHGDLNTPETSPSGAFHGMVLRAIIDAGLVAPADVILLGVRELDDAEVEFMERSGLRRATVETVGAIVAERADAARRDGVEPVLYVHVDLDVLDPAVVAGVGFPTPFGLELAELTSTIADARAIVPLAGAGLTEFAPSGDDDAHSDDLSVILRILAALTRESS